jgi:host factor-I protein
MIAKPPINVQDGFFYQLRKDNTIVEVTLLSEKKRVGRIRRFDKYAVVVEVDGREEMIYKHAIASVVSMAPLSSVHPAPPVAAAVRPSGV